MNPRLASLAPYPFEKLRKLLSGTTPNPALKPIVLSIGEPKHATPAVVSDALIGNLNGLASYPTTIGKESLREAIGGWLARRYGVPPPDAATQIIPTLGSREALFSFAQAALDPTRPDGLVLCPNPFYQIYEGAALLAGLTPHFINQVSGDGFNLDWKRVSPALWQRVQLVYTCSPGNPHGHVMSLAQWQALFKLADQFGFVIAADECYTEIYFDEANPPLGALQAAHQLGRHDYRGLVVLGSLSKRSNVPGMRSGFAAGDAALITQFALYRTYHGSAMSGSVQAASEAAWNDETHVVENRRMYREKFDAFFEIVNPVLPLMKPAASFYYWIQTPLDEQDFTRRLFEEQHVTVLPGSYLAREAHGVNPGRGLVRVALVSSLDETIEAAKRIARFAASISTTPRRHASA